MTISPRPTRAIAGLAVVALLSATHPAAALDPYTPPIWNGVYAGLHGGMNWFEVTAEPDLGTLDISSGQFGAHVGLNYDAGMAVIGVEGDLNFEMGSYSITADSADLGFPGIAASGYVDVTSSGSLRARIGMPIANKALIYATAGYAWASTEYGVNGTYGGRPVSYARSMMFHGIAYGIGAEAFVTDNVVLRVEALRFDYADKPLTFERIGNTGVSIDPSSDVVRAGLSWRFN